MARVTPIDDESANPATLAIFSEVEEKFGFIPNIYRVAANQPAVLSALLSCGTELGIGNFDPRTREAIGLAVSAANSCDYCALAHTAISKQLRIDDTEIAERLQGRSANPRLQAILNFALAVQEKRGRVSDADLVAARKAGLNDGDIMEIVGNVVETIFTNYINKIAQTDIDFDQSMKISPKID